MKKTLIALAVAASAAVSGSAMAWQTGDFDGSVDIGGSITQIKPTWEWKIGSASTNSIDLKVEDATQSGSDNVWSNIGGKAFTILLGRTVSEYDGINAGMAPVITYGGDGFSISHPADNAPLVQLTATGKSDPSKVGTFQFRMNMFALQAAQRTANGQYVYRQIVDTNNHQYGNGFFQHSGYVKNFTATQVKDAITSALGGDMITIEPSSGEFGNGQASEYNSLNLKHMQGAYASEYVVNSGTLTFPKDATPTDWKATLKVTVSYM
ncbi:fimbrial protein [Escherichia coli]|nr:fimbrial protein [Escherichia coli]